MSCRKIGRKITSKMMRGERPTVGVTNKGYPYWGLSWGLNICVTHFYERQFSFNFILLILTIWFNPNTSPKLFFLTRLKTVRCGGRFHILAHLLYREQKLCLYSASEALSLKRLLPNEAQIHPAFETTATARVGVRLLLIRILVDFDRKPIGQSTTHPYLPVRNLKSCDESCLVVLILSSGFSFIMRLPPTRTQTAWHPVKFPRASIFQSSFSSW